MKQSSGARLRILLTLLPVCLFSCTQACVKLSQNIQLSSPQAAQNGPQVTHARPRLDLNTATAHELEALPGIGEALAARIVEHRQRYGRFRRAEHLIMVRGMSDRRFRKLRELVEAS